MASCLSQNCGWVKNLVTFSFFKDITSFSTMVSVLNGLFIQVRVDVQSLDTRYVFLLDSGDRLIVWAGKKSHLVTRTKSRSVSLHGCYFFLSATCYLVYHLSFLDHNLINGFLLVV